MREGSREGRQQAGVAIDGRLDLRDDRRVAGSSPRDAVMRPCDTVVDFFNTRAAFSSCRAAVSSRSTLISARAARNSSRVGGESIPRIACWRADATVKRPSTTTRDMTSIGSCGGGCPRQREMPARQNLVDGSGFQSLTLVNVNCTTLTYSRGSSSIWGGDHAAAE